MTNFYKKPTKLLLMPEKNQYSIKKLTHTAALILEEFIDENKWIHLDIAGPARSDNRKGATGFGVLSLYEFYKNIATDLPEN